MGLHEPGSDADDIPCPSPIGKFVGLRVSVVFPTYGRESVLVDSVRAVLGLAEPPWEVIVVDQTPVHEPQTNEILSNLASSGAIRWTRLERPSITAAMNVGLLQARGDVVLFLDDDIAPESGLVEAHRDAHLGANEPILVAGRVIQPWEEGIRANDLPAEPFRFCSTSPRDLEEFMGGNFSVPKSAACASGGFDENFVRVAYRFEAEFASRWRRRYKIRFVPGACIHHLKAERGGTRSYGDHLKTILPSHSVGQYYYLLRARPAAWIQIFIYGPFRAVVTRFHLRHPWWIPSMFLGHVLGAAWALLLFARGPSLIKASAVVPTAGFER